MSRLAAAANTVWWAASLASHGRYLEALGDVASAQGRLLRRYLRRNADTVWGRRMNLGSIRSVDEYRDRVPLSRYEDYLPYIERIAAGESRVLTRSAVERLQPSAGSTTAAKLIPQTPELRREFVRAIAPWICDLFRSDRRLLGGPGYWSITPPAFAAPAERPRIPIGFDDDTGYLGGWLGSLVGRSLAVPPEVARVGDMASCKYLTLLFLLRSRSLRLISVWHPSFFLLLLDSLAERWGDLCRDVRRGGLAGLRDLPAELRGPLERRLKPRPARARELDSLGPDEPTRIWPELRLFSCWADGPAELTVGSVRRLLPGVRIQPKGLLATEAAVTLPYRGQRLLATRSHFFEFIDPESRPHLANELGRGVVYTVVVTTGGGLYRYRLEDRVEVTGWHGDTPALRFLAKEDHVCDLYGEKLSAAFVGRTVQRLLSGHPVRFVVLAPDRADGRVCYTLYVEPCADLPRQLDRWLQSGLAENPHYRHCARLGQLAPARVFRISGGGYGAYAERLTARGRRLGEIKPTPLDRLSGWSRVFAGSYVEEARSQRSLTRPHSKGRDLTTIQLSEGES